MKVIIYGGCGFVGSHAAQALQRRGAQVTCVSRRGQRPAHLHGEHAAWADQVSWQSDDAAQPDAGLLQAHQVVISTVGAPPLPTMTRAAYQRSLHTNGTANARLLQAAADCGLRRAVLVGAQIPALLQGDWFAYARGKRLSAQAARDFAALSDEHSAVLLQPGGIYGRRHTRGGFPLPLDLLLGPIAKLLPGHLISAQKVADRIAQAALNQPPGFHQINHKAI